MTKDKLILEYVDYAPAGIDLSKLGTEREVSVEELLSDEALHTDFSADKKIQDYILGLQDPSDIMFSNLYNQPANQQYAFEDFAKKESK